MYKDFVEILQFVDMRGTLCRSWMPMHTYKEIHFSRRRKYYEENLTCHVSSSVRREHPGQTKTCPVLNFILWKKLKLWKDLPIILWHQQKEEEMSHKFSSYCATFHWRCYYNYTSFKKANIYRNWKKLQQNKARCITEKCSQDRKITDKILSWIKWNKISLFLNVCSQVCTFTVLKRSHIKSINYIY